MIEGRTPPVLSMLNSAEEIFRMRKRFRSVLLWAILASIWVIVSSVLLITYAVLGKHYGPFVIDAFVVILFLIGLPLLLMAPNTIYSSLKGSDKLEKFIEEFYPIWIKVRFELSVSPEGDLQDKIISVIENLDDDFEKYTENPTIKNDNLNISKNFDIIVKGKNRVAVVKIMDKDLVTEKLELEDNESEALVIAKMLKVKNATLIIVLTTKNKNNSSPLQINARPIKGVRTIVASYDASGFVVEKVTPLSTRHDIQRSIDSTISN